MVLQRTIGMVLQRDSNGFATRDLSGFGTRDSNGFATHDSNGFATQIKWFCNTDRVSNKNAKFKVQSFHISGSVDWVKYHERKERGDSKHRKEVNIVTLS